jgi:hypothetical protein
VKHIVKIHIDKYMSDTFSIRNGLKLGDAVIAIPLQFCFRIYNWKGSGKPARTEIKWDTSVAGLC